ncbi:hypothetical protein [Nocardia sp. BMG111209]|uniref:hypothetical protein n=1 Tax=Nocardia sp. BMG111209 TaxID=1160137 RepID=UPI0012DEA1A7|nr:hypothetical protein [Nocardia sp. BMG111209]
MWQYAVWGFVGAAANLGVVFLEAVRRVKSWPWVRPQGPGGGIYAASLVIQLAVATVTTAALASSAVVPNGLVAFGLGAAAPSIVKKIASYAESFLPSEQHR